MMTKCGDITLDHICSDGATPVTLIFESLLQTVRSLKEVHARGVIHNDIHECNIMVTLPPSGQKGIPKAHIIDFSMASMEGDFCRYSFIPELRFGGLTAPVNDVYFLGKMLKRVLFKFKYHYKRKVLFGDKCYTNRLHNIFVWPDLDAVVTRACNENRKLRPSLKEIETELTQVLRFYESET